MAVFSPARGWATGGGAGWGGERDELRRAGRQILELEGVEDGLDARVVAVGVVVGGAGAEVPEPADQLGEVRARELEYRLALLQRAGAAAEGRGGVLLKAR